MEIQLDSEVKGGDVLSALLSSPLVRGLWEGMSDGALAIDVKTRQIVAMNQKARQLLGYDAQEVLGCQCRKMMKSPSCVSACPLTALLEGRKEGAQLSLYYRGRGEQLLHADTRMLLVKDALGVPVLGIELFRDLREVQALERALGERRSLVGLVGRSEAMQSLYRLVEQIAPYELPVLLTGPSGVGKERFADALQYLSSRADGPYIKVNCAALSPMLVESELFGHTKGAFTGASQPRRGYFEEADGGTLLLDEIGDLPLPLQSKLLRCLEQGELQRLGEEKARKVDVRVLAATNRLLEEEIQAGRFRADLYYRLSGAHLQIPPLSERLEDLPLLAEHLLGRFVEENQVAHPGFQTAYLTPSALSMLSSYDWPGNIRELSHILRLAAIQSQPSGEILPGHLRLPGASVTVSGVPAKGGVSYDPQQALLPEPVAEEPIVSLAVMEREAIERALSHTGGNSSAAARLLGIDRKTLWRKRRLWEES